MRILKGPTDEHIRNVLSTLPVEEQLELCLKNKLSKDFYPSLEDVSNLMDKYNPDKMLLLSTKFNYEELIFKSIEKGADLDFLYNSNSNSTCIYHASVNGIINFLKYLDDNKLNYLIINSFYLAINNNQIELVKYHFPKIINNKSYRSQINTFFNQAISNGFLEIAKFLFNPCFDCNISTLTCVINKQDYDTLDYIIVNNLTAKYDILYTASIKINLDIVKYLINKGINSECLLYYQLENLKIHGNKDIVNLLGIE